MRLMRDILLTVAFLPCNWLAYAQNHYEVPFASRENQIELTVVNKSINDSMHDVMINATGIPLWIRLSPTKQILGKLPAHGQGAVTFLFSVDKSSPVLSPQPILFSVRTGNNQIWTKSISVSVLPPERYELFQNYPNPFNPATTIDFQLAARAFVSIVVYDILGDNVATLVSEVRDPGYYSLNWNAGGRASGVYFVEMNVRDLAGTRELYRRVMKVGLLK